MYIREKREREKGEKKEEIQVNGKVLKRKRKREIVKVNTHM